MSSSSDLHFFRGMIDSKRVEKIQNMFSRSYKIADVSVPLR